jgi:hypothetical protein
MSIKLVMSVKENGNVTDTAFQCGTEREADEIQLEQLYSLEERGARLVDAYILRER